MSNEENFSELRFEAKGQGLSGTLRRALGGKLPLSSRGREICAEVNGDKRRGVATDDLLCTSGNAHDLTTWEPHEALGRLGRVMTGIAPRIQKHCLRTSKSALQSLGLCRVEKPVALSVLGCQRSGTTMLLDAFAHDRRTRVYYEWDSRLFHPSLRLKEPGIVARRLSHDSRHVVVTKPLLDSQWADDLLRTHPQIHAIWIYRHYSAVVKSNLRFFRLANGKRNLAPILRSDHGDWRGERIAPDTLETIRSLVDQNSGDEDAAAMFWFARNSHYFDRDLDHHPRAWLCNYENIVQDPVRALSEIYDAVGVTRPGPAVASEIHQNAGQGPGVRLSAPVEAVCRELWTRLEHARSAQAPVGPS